MTSWSDKVFFTRPRRDVHAGLVELMRQDGFTDRDIRIPPLGSEEFLRLIQDAEAFANEIGTCHAAWPIRSGRWLNRIAIGMTGKPMFGLSAPLRQGVTHAAVMLGGHPELLQ